MRPRYRFFAALLFVSLLAITAGLRLFRLDEIPNGLFLDEGAYGLDAVGVLNGEHALFFPNNNGREGLFIYLIAPLVAWLGRIPLALRLPAALASASSVLLLFWFGQLIFTPSPRHKSDENEPWRDWRGLVIAAIGAGVMAVSFGQTILGRIAFRANLLPPLLILSLGFLWLGLQRRQRRDLVIAGLCTGLLIYTYIPARFFPLLILLQGLGCLLTIPAIHTHWRQWGRDLALYCCVALLIAAPLLLHFVRFPADFVARSQAISIVSPAIHQGNLLGALLENTLAHLKVFGLAGDENWRHNIPGRSLLNPVEALLFWFGIGCAFWRWRAANYRLLLLWLGVLLLPAILSVDGAPNTLRMIGAAPAIYLLIGVGSWHLANGLYQLLAQAQAAYPTGLVGGLIVLVGGLIIWQGINTAQLYFRQWAIAQPVLDNFSVSEWVSLAEQIAEEPAPQTGKTVYLAATNYEYGSAFRPYNFAFLHDSPIPAHAIFSADGDFAERLYNTLAGEASEASPLVVNLVQWKRNLLADATGRIPFLLGKYGRVGQAVEYPSYQLYPYYDLTFDPPWQLYQALEPKPLTYDGGISLQSFALGQHGGEQLRGERATLQPQHTPLWLALQWQADQQPKGNYRLSVRLYNAENAVVYQHDDGIWNFHHASTQQWVPGSTGESLLLLATPVHLAAGEYQLRLVVYDEIILTPTVQVATWQAEIVLKILLVQP